MTTDTNHTHEEPEELAIWREIIAYRDRLSKRIQAGEDAEHTAANWAAKVEALISERAESAKERLEAMQNHEADQKHFAESIRTDAEKACAQLSQLDTSIRKRPKKAPVPRKLLKDILDPALRRAFDAVSQYLKQQSATNGLRAHLALMAVARPGFHWKDDSGTFEVDAVGVYKRTRANDDTMTMLIAKAREWCLEHDRAATKATLARIVVAQVAGLPFDTKRFA